MSATTPPAQEQQPLSIFVPLSVAAIWGINVPVMKIGLQEMDPFFFNAARLTLSALALWLCARFEERGRVASKAPGKAEPLPFRTLLAFALLSSVFYQVLFLWGMDHTSASNTALLIATGPLWTTLLSRAVGMETISKAGAIGLLFAFAGAVLVTVSPGADQDEQNLLGDIVVLLSMMTWAVATVYSRPLLRRISSTRLALASTAYGLPFHWAFAFLASHETRTFQTFNDMSNTMLFALAYSGVLSTGVAYTLWNRSVVSLGPSRTSTYSYLVPVIALAVAWQFLGERPTLQQLAGGVLVISGLAWRQRVKSLRTA